MPLSVASLLLVATATLANGQEFVPITGSVPQDITGVVLPAFCAAKSTVVRTITTLEPQEGNVTVMTYPPDLIRVDTRPGAKDGAMWLLLELNQTVAGSASQGGIRIQLPPSQLERVDACCSARAQIMEGFTNVKSLLASTSAEISATLTASNATATIKDLDIVASTSSKIAVDYSGGDVNLVSVGTSARVDLIANSLTKLDAGTSGMASLQLTTPPSSGAVSTSGVAEISVADGCLDISTSTSGQCTARSRNVLVSRNVR